MNVAEQIKSDLLMMVQKHDYSHMFSDDNRAWEAGMQNENGIKAKIHSLFIYHGQDMEALYNEVLEAVPEQYTNGLTHNTIKNWFINYISK